MLIHYHDFINTHACANITHVSENLPNLNSGIANEKNALFFFIYYDLFPLL